MKIIDPEQSYTFSKIFELKIEPKDLANYFGYLFARKKLNLSQYQKDLDRIRQLKERIEEVLPYASLSSEAARREILISPLIIDLVHYTKSEIFIEYSSSSRVSGSISCDGAAVDIECSRAGVVNATATIQTTTR